MKKLMCKLAALCAAAALFCAFAAAEETIETTVESGYENAVTMADVNQERVSVTVTGVEEGKQYLLIAQNDNAAAPTESNIIYINQDTSSGSSVSFEVFPKELETDKTYYVFLSSDAASGIITARALVGTFVLKEVKQEDGPIFGDLSENGTIGNEDTIPIRQHILKMEVMDPGSDEFKRADLNGDNDVNVNDYMTIIDYLNGKQGENALYLYYKDQA